MSGTTEFDFADPKIGITMEEFRKRYGAARGELQAWEAEQLERIYARANSGYVGREIHGETIHCKRPERLRKTVTSMPLPVELL